MKKKKNRGLDTTVFSVDEYSFKYLKENLEYAFPGRPDDRKTWDYTAFYRTKPVSAVTHYGKIREVIQDAEIDGKYRMMNFGYKAPDEATKIVLQNLEKLDNPVRSEGGRSIQSFHYTKLDYIKKAETISELMSFRRDSRRKQNTKSGQEGE